MPPHEKAGYISINRHIQKMQNTESWKPDAIGGSFYDGDIKLLTVAFIAPADYFNIDHLRSLMINGIETFLTSINTNDQVIPYLNHYPFTYQDIDYGISVYSPEGKWLGHAFLLKGDLVYFKTNEFRNSEGKRTEQIHEEPYPEALHKIKTGLTGQIMQLQSG